MMKLADDGKVKLDPMVVDKSQEQDYKNCSVINDEWNKDVSVGREFRLAMQREERREKIYRNILFKETQKKEIIKRTAEDVKKIQELAPNFITSSNINEAIEKALITVIDHNWAIDIDGNRYIGEDNGVRRESSRELKTVQLSQYI